MTCATCSVLRWAAIARRTGRVLRTLTAPSTPALDKCVDPGRGRGRRIARSLDLVATAAPARAAGQQGRGDRPPEAPAQPHGGIDVADGFAQWTPPSVVPAHRAAAACRED